MEPLPIVVALRVLIQVYCLSNKMMHDVMILCKELFVIFVNEEENFYFMALNKSCGVYENRGYTTWFDMKLSIPKTRRVLMMHNFLPLLFDPGGTILKYHTVVEKVVYHLVCKLCKVRCLLDCNICRIMCFSCLNFYGRLANGQVTWFQGTLSELAVNWSTNSRVKIGIFSVKGVSLLNRAGRFGDGISTTDKTEETTLYKFIVKPVEEIFQRRVVRSAFWLTMQPDQIEAVLKSGVYVNHSNVDDYLSNSFVRSAADPNAYEVYYRLLRQLMSNPTKYTLDSVLSQLFCPLLLLWGDLDPWVHDHAKPNRIKDFYPNTSLVNLQAGNYPQDEVPEQVNRALLDWLSALEISSPSREKASEI
ncbi:hypothetical protein CQW23_05085 [Capsicum baccatum]|uniref:AB hydrolase-1 domain-containing protein n=1 Tax=Capsicum baccatum TaxID=33114 RepID=A0A2G2XGL7_CAPBA|nr:hypothetical protein CQW23_05085 [Capsicum baccatum]